MSGGEPSSIKQKPSCAAELPILSPKCGKAAGCVCSNCLRAVLWSTEIFSIETTLSIEKGYTDPDGSDISRRDKSSSLRSKLLLRLV